MMGTTADFLMLFVSALLAATVVPAQSEVVLAGLHATGNYHPAMLLAVASLGNILGSCINWLLGRYLVHFQHRRWFPVKPEALHRAEQTYRRHGSWTLLFAWVPVIGDPLTVAAGFLRMNLPVFILLVSIGKVSRYIALLWFIPGR